jgi:arabinofuranosyltransferase
MMPRISPPPAVPADGAPADASAQRPGLREADPGGPGRVLTACAWLLVVLWVGWLYRLHAHHLVDDAYIVFRYAEHVRSGLGFVWNPGGPPVEGISDLGWMLALVPFAGTAALPAAAKLLGALGLAFALWWTARAHGLGLPGASAPERALLPLLLVSQAELVYYSLAGMETGLAAALLAGYLLACAAGRFRLGGGLAGALILVRPEAILVPLFHLALASWRPDGDRGAARRLRHGLAAALGVAVLLAGWRLATFGVPWPNTFLAKPPGTIGAVLGRLAAAFGSGETNLPAPYTGLGFLAVAPLGWWILRRRSRALADAAAAATLAGVVFAVYAPTDWTETGRFFAAWVPAAALLGVRGVFAAAAGLAAERRRLAAGAATAVLVAATVGGAWRSLDLFGPPRTGKRPGYVVVGETLVPAAEHLARTLPPDAVIATRRLGAIGYFTDRRIFDYSNGLTEPEVARLVRAHGSDLGTPRSPLLADLWHERAPDYVLEDLDIVLGWLEPGETPQDFSIQGIPYHLAMTFPLGDGTARWALVARQGAPTPPPMPAEPAANESHP